MIKINEGLLIPTALIQGLLINENGVPVVNEYIYRVFEEFNLVYFNNNPFTSLISNFSKVTLDNIENILKIEVLDINNYNEKELIHYLNLSLNLNEKLKENFENIKKDIFEYEEDLNYILNNIDVVDKTKILKTIKNKNFKQLQKVLINEIEEYYNIENLNYWMYIYKEFIKGFKFNIEGKSFEEWFNNNGWEFLDNLQDYLFSILLLKDILYNIKIDIIEGSFYLDKENLHLSLNINKNDYSLNSYLIVSNELINKI